MVALPSGCFLCGFDAAQEIVIPGHGERSPLRLHSRCALHLAATLLSAIPGSPTHTHPTPLTARQRAVLEGLMRGETNAQIGQRLSLSERTIKNLIGEILITLDARSRTQAVAIAIRRGLVS